MDFFEEAKRRSLVLFLEEQMDAHGKTCGRRSAFKACPNCGPSRKGNDKLSVLDDRHWTCFSCGEGGTIVDAAMMLWKIDAPLEAARQIVGSHSPVASASTPPAPPRASEAVAEVIRRLWLGSRRNWEPAVSSYLQSRGIKPSAIALAWERGILGSMPSDAAACAEWLRQVCGDGLLREAGLWHSDRTWPWAAYRQILVFPGGLQSCELRTIHAPRPGSDHKKSLAIGRHAFPVFLEARPAATCCLVVEGIIDLLSAISMNYAGHYLMLAGVTCWRPEWFESAAERYGIRHWDIALDNDIDDPNNPGQTAARKIEEACRTLGLSTRNVSPPAGDLNDVLTGKATRQVLASSAASL